MGESDLKDVQAEVIAIQAVLIAVLRQLARQDSGLAPLFAAAFEEAESMMCGVAIKLGMEPMLGTSTAALAVIEELRQAVMGPRQP